ncbi:MAG: aldehyde oxygenase (deformylating) [Pseudanabaena sp.]|jgi:fatty aldehyde decarbonylase|nr:aldehyde oxygenase (deformylating) [Pseudanabaena sp. M051S1SP2A07QC]MCA6573034.1 aldehyde oxygenase (deformylating) [Pseudanabaena sp. M53BS1SP1A06MG]MCA6581600.1 aldehyde oxygenase (deformylating) [Pseudanabaena sp. M34BS1SP1A06MG]MCA6589972.1 aldehyde oxygenase (deformylating) [Pseudanabaena sp. M109S1SP1A06QC]MCA6591213.1 aldehyde oxygenase (deformylating) [Pseudanabaena sp. M38BS1SP1A06MG]MCA6597900.1 aldehyde oxygenase (deformylating) [Pseudanabaena sp. M046S1SP1A06QC]MCA6602376.1 al
MGQTLEAVAITDQINYQTEQYRDAYSRINAIVIEGEAEAYSNYLQLAELLPESKTDLIKLAKMEERHKKGFTACGKNLNVTPDMEFAEKFFAELHGNFQKAFATKDIVTCLLIQSLVIECFAIAAYNIYIPVADPFARKITEGVVKDEYLHLNFGEEWLQEHFEQSKANLEQANRQNLPIVWKMLNQVETDAKVLGMEKEALVEDFMIQYGESLGKIGFNTRDIMKMSAMGLLAA